MKITLPRVSGVDLSFEAPPSKSCTHRALIAGALATGDSEIINPLPAGDILVTIRGLRCLGIPVEVLDGCVRVAGCGGALPCGRDISLDMDNSGTSLRLLTSVGLLCHDPVLITGSRRMQERPVMPLVTALNDLGGEIRYLGEQGYPPILVDGVLRGGKTQVDGSISSQFISSLLITAPYAREDVDLEITSPLVSRSYLDITTEIMRHYGVEVARDGYRHFRVAHGRGYTGQRYAVEGDYSSASYLFAIAAICGGKVVVKNLKPDSVQGDRLFLSALAQMGCSVKSLRDGWEVERTGALHGITIDMSAAPDTVQTLCMVAATAETPTTIRGIHHLRFKESDRVMNTAERLRQLGAGVEVSDDAITISPSPLRGGAIDPEDDHRTAMSFAVLGLGTGGMTIHDAECVNKSYPEFWQVLKEGGLW